MGNIRIRGTGACTVCCWVLVRLGQVIVYSGTSG